MYRMKLMKQMFILCIFTFMLLCGRFVQEVSAFDLYLFNTDSQGWYINQRGEVFPYGNPNLTWDDTTDFSNNQASGSLKLHLDLQGDPQTFDATIIQSPDYGMPGQQTQDFSSYEKICAMVFVPSNALDHLEAVVFTKSGNNWSWSQGPWTTLATGRWNRIQIETTWIATPNKVEAIGVKIGGNVYGGGTVWVDHIEAVSQSTGEVLTFDFNYNRNMVTASGFSSAIVETYTSQKGYGYMETLGVYSFARYIVDPLRRDGHYGFSQDGHFVADIENGLYDVSIHYGEKYVATDMVDVYAEGLLKLQGLATGPGEFKTGTFSVDVRDGKLDLVFHEGGGVTPYWAINGIEIRPPQADTDPPATSASPAGGTYDSVQTIILTANEPATIYYTTDGSTPTTSSPVYDQPIYLAADSTLRFFAVDTAGNIESPYKIETYIIQTYPNEIKLDLDHAPNVDTAVGYTSITVTPYDAVTGYGYQSTASVYSFIRSSGASLQRDCHYSQSDSEFKIDLKNGSYQVTIYYGERYICVDAMDILAENQLKLAGLSTIPGEYKSSTFDVDVTDGQLNLVFHDGGGNTPYWIINGIEIKGSGSDILPPNSSANPPGGTYTKPQYVAITANEPATIYFTVDGSEPTVSSQIYTDPVMISTDTTLKFFAKDIAGNTESPVNAETYAFVAPPPYTFQITPNTDPIGMYERFELTVSWDESDQYSNPFNPDEVKLTGIFTAPGGTEWRIPGFRDGSEWKIRFAANEIGPWDYIIEVEDYAGTNQSTTATFSCVGSGFHGWIKQSNTDIHYFVHDDGSPFFGIGHNRCWSLEHLGWTSQDGYTLLTEMAAHGMNVLGFWMAPWDTQLITLASGYDSYDINRAREMDAIVEDAERKGIKIVLAIWAHDALRDTGHPWGSGQWDQNPFKDLSTCNDFMTDSVSWSYQEKLYRYIIARWGYSRSIGLWHTICEIEGIGTYSSIDSRKNQWHQKITQFFQQHDPFGHPTTGSNTHWTGVWSSGYSVMDTPQIHVYEETGNPVNLAGRIAYWTDRLINDQNKPVFIGEFGTSNQNLQPQHIHNGTWAGLSSGGAITPLDWNDGGAWGDMTAEMFDSMLVLSQFAANIPFGVSLLEQANITVDSCNSWGLRMPGFAFGWVLAPDNNTVSGSLLTINGLEDGPYTIEWWDTWTGQTQGAQAASMGGILTIKAPDFSGDIAFKILSR